MPQDSWPLVGGRVAANMGYYVRAMCWVRDLVAEREAPDCKALGLAARCESPWLLGPSPLW